MFHSTAGNAGHGQLCVKTYMQLQIQCNMLCVHLITTLLNTGTDWAGKSKFDAQAALKIRYGIEDDAQGWQGLEIVSKHMKIMYALPDYVPDDSSDCSSDHSLYGSSDHSFDGSYNSSD